MKDLCTILSKNPERPAQKTEDNIHEGPPGKQEPCYTFTRGLLNPCRPPRGLQRRFKALIPLPETMQEIRSTDPVSDKTSPFFGPEQKILLYKSHACS